MKFFLAFLLACFSVYGVCSDVSWDTGYPNWKYWSKDVVDIPDTRIFKVQEASQEFVIERLEEVELIQLSLPEARQLIGENYASEKATKPFLVRGVYMHKFTGEFSLYLYEGELLVTHNSLGEHVRVSKLGLVINIEEKPTKLFVTAGSDL